MNYLFTYVFMYLYRLSKEKVAEPQKAQNIIRPSRRDRLLENLKKAGVTDFTMKKAVPGTGIAGEKVRLKKISHRTSHDISDNLMQVSN